MDPGVAGHVVLLMPMTKVNFYVNVAERQGLLLRLLKKVLAERQTAVLWFDDANAARRCDEWLWLFDELAFLPHALADADVATRTPIVLAWPGVVLPACQVLINQAVGEPPVAAGLEKLLEIVSSADDDKTQARERFRRYRERGWVLETFDMAGRA